MVMLMDQNGPTLPSTLSLLAGPGQGIDTTVPGTLTVGATNATSVKVTPNAVLLNGLAGHQGGVSLVSAAAGATVVLTAAQSGAICYNASTSGTPAWTLPPVAAGLVYTFFTLNTTAGVLVKTVDASVIKGKTSPTGTAITSTATTGNLHNTQATAVVGDFITVASDGTNWYVVSQSGTWAAT